MSIWKVSSAQPSGRSIWPKVESSDRQDPRLEERAEEKGGIIWKGLMISER